MPGGAPNVVGDLRSADASPLGHLSASRRLLTLEHFRTPYSVCESPDNHDFEWLLSRPGGPALLWPARLADQGTPVAAFLRLTNDVSVPLFGRILPDSLTTELLPDGGRGWSPTITVLAGDGERAASIWRADDGSILLPFDPDEVRLGYLSERYHELTAPPAALAWRRLAMLGYYRARDLMPRRLQIALRRRYARVQARARFPRWPIETGLHDFLDLFFFLVQSIAEEPVPRIASWPNGYGWALVLTHDVETAVGVENLPSVVALEQSLGLRSSWNFVPRRYEVTIDQVCSLVSQGFEVGVHGLYHDGRDLESPAMVRERLPGMQEAATRWDAVGFRSPATHRGWDLMPMLGFDYDSSYPDTDPFEPQGGGCCSWLPFFNGDLVELPLTMPQDHTLFVILRQRDEQAWVEKAELLRSRGGMALIDTHPDYLTDQHILDAYHRFLECFAGDPGAWKALPREVSAWWRRRSQSQLELVGGEWIVTGPGADEARVEFATTSPFG